MAKSKTGTSQVDVVERVKRFVKGVWSELKKVHWPDRKTLLIYTGVVLAATILVAALIWIADSFLSLLLGFLR